MLQSLLCDYSWIKTSGVSCDSKQCLICNYLVFAIKNRNKDDFEMLEPRNLKNLEKTTRVKE